MLHFIKLIERTFRMNHKIYPLAYKLSPKQTCTLYYLGFPTSWKAVLLNIARKTNPKFKDEYGLPTNALKKLVDSWMEGIIALAPLKKDAMMSVGLRPAMNTSEEICRALCGIIMTWVKATYVTSSRVNPIAKKSRKRILRYDELGRTCGGSLHGRSLSYA